MTQNPDKFANYEDRLELAKKASTSQLLFRTSRLLQDMALELMRGKTYNTELRASHMSLAPHIDLQGTRLTLLADRLGVSKQAAGQLVDDMEKMGIVERVKDPEDGRAKLIQFSEAGRTSLLRGLSVLRRMENALAKQLGEDNMEHLHKTLLDLENLLETKGSAALQYGPSKSDK